ncbi:unnamed protein product [Closterium sp. Yama58-4]|nr:unnamed protein product [Closterium sp. Yama58-4]
MGSDPWRTDGRHGAEGGHGYRQDTGVYRSPEEGYRRREERSRGRGLEEFFSGRQGNLDVDGEDEADSANQVRETNREGETKGDDGSQEEGAGEQREMPAGVKDDDPAHAGVAAEPSATEADEKGGTRDLPRDGEKGDGGGRGSGARSPDPRQQRDKGRGGGARSPDPRLHRDGGRSGGARSPEPPLNRDGGRGGGARSPDPRVYREGGRNGGMRSPDRRQTRDGERGGGARSPDPRLPYEDGRRGSGYRSPGRQPLHAERHGGGYRSPVPRQHQDGGRRGSVRSPDPRRYHDWRSGGELRSPDPRYPRDERRGGGYRSPDPQRYHGESIGNRAGMRGAAAGITHLSGTGSMTEDVLVREDGSNATAEGEAAG